MIRPAKVFRSAKKKKIRWLYTLQLDLVRLRVCCTRLEEKRGVCKKKKNEERRAWYVVLYIYVFHIHTLRWYVFTFILAKTLVSCASPVELERFVLMFCVVINGVRFTQMVNGLTVKLEPFERPFGPVFVFKILLFFPAEFVHDSSTRKKKVYLSSACIEI